MWQLNYSKGYVVGTGALALLILMAAISPCCAPELANSLKSITEVAGAVWFIVSLVSIIILKRAKLPSLAPASYAAFVTFAVLTVASTIAIAVKSGVTQVSQVESMLSWLPVTSLLFGVFYLAANVALLYRTIKRHASS